MLLFLWVIPMLASGQVTYYFDASEGDDNHSVNSRETPWQTLRRLNEITFNPGDSVLLKAGSTWEGKINLKGSGIEGYPITLGSYGNGPWPKIDGSGAEGAVVTLNNLSYWKLSNLEITNPASSQGGRIGLLIMGTGGNHGHYHLDSLYIHDIFGRYSFEMTGKNTGGIGIIGGSDTRFDDILIENCVISDIVRVGIFTNGNKGTNEDRPITNLVIRKNTVSRCAGDGMIIRYAHRPLIEHNLATENHNAPEELVEYGVAIWVRSTYEAVIQYNRVFDTKGRMDGQAFDADLEAYRTVVQYNYTRNNEGGFMLVYGSSQDAIIRYNISQNDGLLGKHIFDFPIWTSPRGSGIIHNNMVYIGEEINAVLADEALATTKFYNNIVINEGDGALIIRSEGQTAEFSNNCLTGYDPAITSINKNPVQGDPGLVNPGRGETEFSSLEGYRITPGSPCLAAGLPVSLMEGSYWFNEEMTDFWGNPVNQESPDVGVHQLSAPNDIPGNLSGYPEMIRWEVNPVPFTDGFFLSVDMRIPLELQIKLCDISGRYINTLYSGKMTSGNNKLYCNTQGNSGTRIGPGIYFLHLTSPEIPVKESRMIIHYE